MMQGFRGFQHVTVSVGDVDRALAFYRDVLGFRRLGRLYYRNKAGLVIDFLDIGNDALLELFSFQVPTKPSEWVPNDLQLGLRHIGFAVGSVDVVAAHLRDVGVEFTMDPQDAHGKVRIAFFKDPDGTLLELVEGQVQYDTELDAGRTCRRPHRIPAAERRLIFDHVALTVSDLKAALRFYCSVLGFAMLGQLAVNDGRGFTITHVQAGSAVLELFSFAMPTIERAWDSDETVLGLKHLGFLVDDVDAVANRLAAADVRFIYPPTDALGAVKTAFFADPDGNALELIDGTCRYDE